MSDPPIRLGLISGYLNNYKIHRLNEKGQKIREGGKAGEEREKKSRVERKGQSSIGRSIEKVRRYAIERCGITLYPALRRCVLVIVMVVVVVVIVVVVAVVVIVVVVVLDERSRRDTRTKK